MRSLVITQSITTKSEAALVRYLSEIARHKPLSAEEEVTLAKKVKEGDAKARERMIRANLKFVVSCAKQYQGMGLSLSDLVAEGNLGLIEAVELFDPSKGFKFITYAVFWIRKAIMDSIGSNVRTIRLPANMIRDTAKVRKTSERMEMELQRLPTQGEIYQEIGLPADNEAMKHAYSANTVSLDTVFGEDEDTPLWSMLPSSDTTLPDSELKRESLRAEVEQLLKVLPERERDVLRSIYGIDMDRPISFEEIGERMELGGERVRQLKKNAIKRISGCVRQLGRHYEY